MKTILEKYKNIIVPIILRYIPDAKIILYGSRARGDERAGSDIDVALDNNNVIDDLLMSKIVGDLEESDLPISFDVVDFRLVSQNMRDEIVRDGIIWKA
jgi:uncharacterized protein